MKKLRDICLDFIANNLYGNITCIVHNLARVHKEELLERMVCHDQLDKILLPHVTYNLFSASLKRVTFYRSSQVTDKILLQLSNSGCQLTHLTIVECALVTDAGIRYITKGQNDLEYLKLHDLSIITGKGFKDFSCESIKKISLKSCSSVTSSGVRNLLKKNSSITHLTLATCKQIDDTIIPAIADRVGKSLVSLNVSDLYCLSNSSLHQLATNCPNLQKLNILGCNQITHEGLSKVVECCTKLTKLELSYCFGLQQKAYSCLGDLSRLRSLSIAGVLFDNSDCLAESLMKLTSLRQVHLSGIPALTDEAFHKILSVIGKNLEKLDLSGGLISPLTDSGISAITKYCTNLSYLGLSLLKDITGFTLLPLLRNSDLASKLRSLHMSCPKLCLDVLSCISQNCDNLESLSVSGVPFVDDHFVRAVAHLCPRLSEINLKACRRVTDKGVCCLANNCPLRSVVVSGINLLTDVSIYTLANECPYLEEIYVSGCYRISETALNYLADNCIRRLYVEHRVPYSSFGDNPDLPPPDILQPVG